MALPAEHRLEAILGRIGPERRQAEERDAATGRVEAGRGQAERGRAVRDVARQVRVGLGGLAEALDLALGEGRIGVRGREVSHQTDDLGGRLGQLRQAVAAHARVELQVAADALGHLAVGDDQLEPCVSRLRDLAACGGAHDEDPRGRELAPERECLGDGRETERGRPDIERRTGDVRGAVPVAVRLDDRPQLGLAERAAQRRDVPPQRPQVDGQLRAVHTD